LNLQDYQERWAQKPVLRAIYADLYKKISDHCADGDVLEIGGGIGNFSISGRRIVRTDIQPSEGTDVAADAHQLPFASGSFSSIVLFDVLHHLECPHDFLREASRVLSPGGRMILVEPYISPVSWIFYHYFHEEDVDLSWRPRTPCAPDPDKNPYDSNQAIPTLLFGKKRLFEKNHQLPLYLIEKTLLSTFVYPLSGGFKRWSLLPHMFVGALLSLDDWMARYLGKLMAFRMLVVLEKSQ